MRKWPRHLFGVIAVAAGILAAQAAQAATCTLELKRLEPPNASGVVIPGVNSDMLYRMTTPQSFFVQVMAAGRTAGQQNNFSEVVKKEPAEYKAENPFRGVAKLGSQQYGWALDAKDKDAKGYSRLYFDLNHNGDLTDDKVIEATPAPARAVFSISSMTRHQFPRVDVTVDADGTKVDYAFFFSVYSQTSGDFRYASASLTAAAYRQGEITLDGKSHQVVVLDFNSNGRFGDVFAVRELGTGPDEQIYPVYGDVLLMDPDPGNRSALSYDVTTSKARHNVSKVVNLDGQLYSLEISAAGDQLSLTPSDVSLGYITNPNEGFRAEIYSENGFLKISGDGSKPVPVPEGDWKLLSYTIDRTGYEKPAETNEAESSPKNRSVLQLLSDALTGGSSSSRRVAGPQPTLVSARATKAYPAVKVRKGETVVMPFGPPLKPVVKVTGRIVAGQPARLGLSIVDSTGAVCNNLLVDGKRPDKPEFTITTPDGTEVAQGSFEYG